jgi:hypothetical protein
MAGLELPGGGRVLFTTREHGNLSTLVGPDADDGPYTRERLRKRLGLHGLVHARQVHGTTIRRVGGAVNGAALAAGNGHGVADGAPAPAVPTDATPEADGHATAMRGIGVMVLVADCLPVALAGDGAVAMVHAGWRGLAGGVLEEGVRALREIAGEGEITAVIGPGAGVCCYEVGEEVHAAFGEDHPHREGSHIDLRGLARERLERTGVARVEDVPLCTICEASLFSRRREGDAAGRQAGVAWLE